MEVAHATQVGPRARRSAARLVVLACCAAGLAVTPTGPAAAARGDFTLNLMASAPQSYDHLVGGGAVDDGTNGKALDIVESLEGGDFSCGDVVTYLTQVSVEDTASAGTDGPQTIEVDYSFTMDSTGTSGAALGDIVRVGVNYAPVADLVAGEDTVDSGIVDDGDSTAVLTSETQVGTVFTSGARLAGTVRVTGLERAEVVVVRMDVRILCQPGTRPTGNLQGQVDDARLTQVQGGTAVPSSASAIPVGAQTVPFQKIGDLRVPELEIEKTVSTAGGSCPGTEDVAVTSGDSVTYCFQVSNPSDTTSPPGAALYDVSTVRDDNHTPGDTSDDYTVALAGLTDLDGDGTADDLGPGVTATGQQVVQVTTTAATTFTNTGHVTGSTWPGDTVYRLTDSDTATVAVAPSGSPPAHPAITTQKAVVDADLDGVAELGEVLTYTIGVTNSGDVALGDVRITDPMLGLTDVACGSGALAAATSRSCLTATYVVTQADVDAGTIENTATGSGLPPTGPRVSDADTASIPTPPPPVGTPDLVVDKSAPSALAQAGQTLTYTITVGNEGDGAAEGVVVSDVLPPGTTFRSASPGCTATGQTVTCALGTLAAGDTRTVTVTTDVASYVAQDEVHDHQLDVTKVESHLSLPAGQTGTATTTCPTGMVALDGSVRTDAVDQGTGTLASALVTASHATAGGTGWTGTVVNTATGQWQGKVNVVCVSTGTTSGEDHVHPLGLSDPAGATATDVALPVGTTEVTVTCPTGTLPVAPGFTLDSGASVVTTRHDTVESMTFVARTTSAGSGDVGVRCLEPRLAEVDGHEHELTWSELTDSTSVPAGGVATPRLTCPVGSKGIVAWADLPGVPLGTDPQPITREFRFHNPGAAPVTATYGLLCLAIRSSGVQLDTPIVNTATVSTTSHEDDLTDNSDSATVTVRSVQAAPRAVTTTTSRRTTVAVRLAALVAGEARVLLVADHGVHGTTVRRGTTLARAAVSLEPGEQEVALESVRGAGAVLRSGAVRSARVLVVDEHGTRAVGTVRVLRRR